MGKGRKTVSPTALPTRSVVEAVLHRAVGGAGCRHRRLVAGVRAGGGRLHVGATVAVLEAAMLVAVLGVRAPVAPSAVDETVILLHPPPPVAGVSIEMERGRQQTDSLVRG